MSKYPFLVHDFVVDEVGDDEEMRWPKALVPPRTLQTYLSDSELNDCGLSIFVDGRRELRTLLSDQIESDEWLVKDPSNWVNLVGSRPTWEKALLSRLKALRQIASEEDLPFSEQSAEAVEKFVQRLLTAMHPSIFLIGNGNIRLLWKNDIGEQVGLQFIDGSRIQFVFFINREGVLSHYSGIENSSHVLNSVKTLGLGHLVFKRFREWTYRVMNTSSAMLEEPTLTILPRRSTEALLTEH